MQQLLNKRVLCWIGHASERVSANPVTLFNVENCRCNHVFVAKANKIDNKAFTVTPSLGQLLAIVSISFRQFLLVGRQSETQEWRNRILLTAEEDDFYWAANLSVPAGLQLAFFATLAN